jgi:hypothetical protein
MSLSLKKLDVIKVVDPRCTSSYKSDYIYLQGAANVSQKSYTTSSVSTSSLQFTAQPPNRSIYVTSRPLIQTGTRLFFSGVSTAIGQTLINPNRDAPRAYPFSSGVDVMNVTLNNFSVSVNLADILHPFLRYNVTNKLKNHLYSTAPSYPDQSQLYSSLVGSVRSPLAGYGDSTDENVQGRGGYCRYAIVTNPVSTSIGQTLNAIVDLVTTEEFFFLSPLNWKKHESHSFINLVTFDANITMLGNAANRMWSRDETSLPLTSLTFQFAQLLTGGPAFSFPETSPVIMFEYYQPKESTMLPLDNMAVYPYFDIQRFPTDITGVPQWPASSTFSSNNIQLSSYPKRIYIYARQPNNILYSSCTNTDTFATISNINIQLNARSGLMASSSQAQLYEMSCRNGCSLSYTQWTGGPVYTPGTFASTYGSVGSILALDPALDLGLSSIESDGKNSQVTFQVNVTLSSQLPGINAYTLYVAVVNEGVFCIHNTQATAQIGVLTSEDILNAKMQPGINLETIKSISGGDFLSGLKQFWGNIVRPILQNSRLASNLASAVPIIGNPLSQSIRNLGYGDGVLYSDDGSGGVLVGGAPVGGRMMRESNMRRRIMM